MKRLIYIFIILLFFSCKNETSKSLNEDFLEFEAVPILEEAENESFEKPEFRAFKYEDLTKEKLQEFFDLLALKEKHPEFNEMIVSRLKDYSKDSTHTSVENGNLVENISLKGEVIKASDSVQKMKLVFDLVSNEQVRKDSIWAIISTKKMIVNGQDIESNKIHFSKN